MKELILDLDQTRIGHFDHNIYSLSRLGLEHWKNNNDGIAESTAMRFKLWNLEQLIEWRSKRWW